MTRPPRTWPFPGVLDLRRVHTALPAPRPARALFRGGFLIACLLAASLVAGVAADTARAVTVTLLSPANGASVTVTPPPGFANGYLPLQWSITFDCPGPATGGFHKSSPQVRRPGRSDWASLGGFYDGDGTFTGQANLFPEASPVLYEWRVLWDCGATVGFPGAQGTSEIRTFTLLPLGATPPPSPPPPPPPPPPAQDRTPPAFTLTSPSGKLTAALNSGLRLALTTNEGGKATVTLTVSRATARKLKLKRPASGPVKVGGLTRVLPSGRSTVAVKLTAAARRAIKKVRKVKLLITVVINDAAGNSAVRTMTVTLKR